MYGEPAEIYGSTAPRVIVTLKAVCKVCGTRSTVLVTRHGNCSIPVRRAQENYS